MAESLEMRRLLEPNDAYSETSSVSGIRGKAKDFFQGRLDETDNETDTTYDSDHTTKSMKEAHSSPYRWLVLFLYSFNTLMMSVSAICLATITNVLLPFYDAVDDNFTVTVLVNIPSFTYIVFAVPFSIMTARYGLRPVIIFASVLTTLSCGLRYAGSHKAGFNYIIASQFFASMSYSMLLQMPAKLAKVWFPKYERAIATSIGAYMYILGVAVGFLWSSRIVSISPELLTLESSLKILHGSQIGLSLLLFVLTVALFKEEPSSASVLDRIKRMDNQEQSFLKSMIKLMKNKRFHMIGHAYGIYWGINDSLSLSLDLFVRSLYKEIDDKEINWLGFTKNVSSVATVVALAMLLDRFQRYRLISTITHASSFVLFTVFFISGIFGNYFGLFASYCIYGLVAVPYITNGLQHIALLTEPVSEVTSSAFVLVLSNFYGCVLSILFAYGIEHTGIYLGFIMSGLYLISTLLVLFTARD